MFRDIVTKNGSLLMYMTSAPIVTSRYSDMSSDGMVTSDTSTPGDVFRTVLPLSIPTTGPNIFSAATMSARETGQLGSRFLSTISMNSRVLGRPTIC